MKISVIIATKNEEVYVKKCLDSLFFQTRRPDEVIIIDGYSNDKTLDIVKKYPVRIFYDKGDLGTARQLGFEKAKNEILVFTDADCVFDRNWLKEIERAFSENPHIAGIQGRVKMNSFLSERFYRRCRKVGKMTFTHGCNMIFKKESIKKVGGFDSNKNCGWEDMDIGYRISRLAPVIYWPYAMLRHLQKTREDDWKVIVRNGKYWVRFAKKYKKPQFLVRPYYYVLVYFFHKKIKKAITEFFGLSYGIFKELIK